MKNKHKVLFTLALAATMMSGAEVQSCRLTFSGSAGAETLKDFPALIKIPDGLTGFNYADSSTDGSDLAFFGADGQQLAYEIDTWDPEGDSYVWVRVPEVTKSTTITARWGNPGGHETTSVQQQGVWSDDYMGVWHFSKFRKCVTRDSKNGLEAEVRGKDTRLFIHADAFVGKGYLDEMRLSKAVLSPDRIRADYLTLTRPTQFAVAARRDASPHRGGVLTRRLAEGDTPPIVPDVGSWRGVLQFGDGTETFVGLLAATLYR